LRRALFHLSFKKEGTLTMSIISAENINFSYAAKSVMEKVSFAIDAAQIVAIIGPNGSGKTTLLKIINARFSPMPVKCL